MSARVLAYLARCEQSQRVDPSSQRAARLVHEAQTQLTLLTPSLVARLIRREQLNGVSSTMILLLLLL